jgi:hypothetical protein
MTVVETPQSRCRVGVGRCEITPPVGIYHRMWGAATHERASGVHQPLVATLLWLEPVDADASGALVIVALDHCILDGPDVELFQRAVAEAAGIQPGQVLVTLSHTHAAGLMSRSRADLPGGELIGPYLDSVAVKIAGLAAEAASGRRSATIIYGRGRCGLAANRDFFDAERAAFVCGFNPAGTADDTVMVVKIVDDEGRPVAGVVNYACHATTLAWQNTLISPDYVGAMRETVERQMGAPCVFLQGASADLGPRDGFVGDVTVAERNGRELGFAALAALEGLPPPTTRFVYRGPVVSGATIGTWQHEALDSAAMERLTRWEVARWNESLAYRNDLPTIAEAEGDLERWKQEEIVAQGESDAARARECRARAERAERQLWRLKALAPGAFPLPITVARLGEAVWVFVAGEHYQMLQTKLRERFAPRPIIVATLTSGWQPGYIPPAEIYGRGIYQEQIAGGRAGSAERVSVGVGARVEAMVAGDRSEKSK